MPKFTIPIKLLLLSLVTLSIPYVGFQYLRETERYLQSSLEDSLLAVAGALSVSLQNHSSIFNSAVNGDSHRGALFVHTLRHPIQLDGYLDEWLNYAEWSETFDVLADGSGNRGLPQSALGGFKLVLGEFEQHLYVMLDVKDSDLRYRQTEQPGIVGIDAVEIVYSNQQGEIERAFISPPSPGSFTAHRIVENWDFTFARTAVANIVGAWQETGAGYSVEIRIPLHLLDSLLGFVVHDGEAAAGMNTFDAEREQQFGGGIVAASNGARTVSQPNSLLRTSAQLDQVINRVGLKRGQRIWVLNRSGQVLASAGSLTNEKKKGAINFLYTWILPAANEDFEDDLASASRLRSSEVLGALQGQVSSRWRSSPDERAVIVSAAHPIRSGNELIGAVVVEETTNSIQTLQRDAMASLYNKSIVVIIGVTSIILLFAVRLSWRIIKLRNDAESAIDDYGRVVGDIDKSTSSDELGDLSRSYAAMLSRLAEYNGYLEGMASKLSHEIRTPLSVLSTSLENLADFQHEEAEQRYLDRAREGIDRLRNLVTRLSEAARIEQSIAQAEKSELDLVALLEHAVEAYQQTYSSRRFRAELDRDCPLLMASGDLVVQMLDKLVENAVQFSEPQSEITLCLARANGGVEVSVTNSGPPLPQQMQEQIFNSMISMREKRAADDPHLGLGLFIVRLIAEFHDGTVRAENLPNADGVRFTVSLGARVGVNAIIDKNLPRREGAIT